ncbi:hypothetical protein Hanom_Chr09g00802981 [Helianthus anomalus]
MSWFNLNYFFGDSSNDNTNTFIQESRGFTVSDSYNGRLNDDHTEDVVSSFHSHKKESLLPDLNKRMGFCIMNTVMVPRPDKKTMAITFSLVMYRTYNKTLVSILTLKSHWVASNPLTRKTDQV